MVVKSYGRKRGTRNKFAGKKRAGINHFLRKFKIGEKVHIDIYPSQKGFPHHRFQGKTGEIEGRRGDAYIIKVKDMDAIKRLIIKPEHIKPKGGE